MKVDFRPYRLLLVVWFSLGIYLRLWHLTAKPPWTDEFSTLVFSLGNSFLGVPRDVPISLDILLQPLQPNVNNHVRDVITRLTTESNHPPLYFVLTHLWTRLFSLEGSLVSLWGARSLAAIFGALSVPGIYVLTWITFRSKVTSHLAAAIMAVSPYGIFLAQEARHYTLGILWVIASYACMVIAIRHIQSHTQLPLWITLSWLVINALGIATHYFFTFTLYTEFIVFLILGWQFHSSSPPSQVPTNSPAGPSPPWHRILMVAVGTLMAGLVWIPVFLHNSYGDRLTDWIQGERVGISWISPIFQVLAAWITMICLLPVESPNLAVMIAAGLIMLIFFIWATPILIRGLKIQLSVRPQTRFMLQVFSIAIASVVALFFVFTYFLGIDLTRGARYSFVYFPGVIMLVGASLAVYWHYPENFPEKLPNIKSIFKLSLNEGVIQDLQKPPLSASNSFSNFQQMGKWGIQGKKVATIVFLMGLLSAVTVVHNLGYQKYYRPDLFVQLVQQKSQGSVILATAQMTHVQIGEMMGVAREFKLKGSKQIKPSFFLAHQDNLPNISSTTLDKTLKILPRPFDLWLVNFPVAVEDKGCVADKESLPGVHGYVYKLYHCGD